MIQLEMNSENGWTKFALGYQEAIRLILKEIKCSNHSKEPLLILPLFFLVGHGLELLIKALMKEFGYKIEHEHKIKDYFEQIEPNLRDVIGARIENLNHNITDKDIDNIKELINYISKYYPIQVRYPKEKSNLRQEYSYNTIILFDEDVFDGKVTEAYSTLNVIQFLHLNIKAQEEKN
ncbi:MAG: hypothetical protein FD166_3619 [Bacteroidetes bacterium]|nr:MAG: hypothetical protein FD166_3619 [Bacteroidota bacterium]